MHRSEAAQSDSASRVRRGVLSLFFANGLSFGVIGWSYLALSRILTPADLGLYSAALAVGSFGTMVLDAGLKNTVIKANASLKPEEEGILVGLLLLISMVLVGLLALLSQPLSHYRPEVRHDYRFLVLFGATYLISYPLTIVHTAILERRLSYVSLAWIESLGLLIERVVPLPLLLWSHAGIHSFTLALIIGRTLRVVALAGLHPVRPRLPTRRATRQIGHLLTEGIWFQLAMAASLVRDNLNVLLIGPLFGKQWVGYYAWGLQLCMIASQAFVQIASRVSLPLLAQSADRGQRWRHCLTQTKILTILTGPAVMVLLAVVTQVDRVLFAGKWELAITFLPLLFVRMLPGMSTTPLGVLVMVQAGNRAYARASLVWTACEVVGAVALVAALGPVGLAWSMSFCGWFGVAALTRAAGPSPSGAVRGLLAALILRPSLVCAAVGAWTLHQLSVRSTVSLVQAGCLGAAVVLTSIALEPTARKMVIQRKRAA